jgi:hypothetical protein
MDGRNAGSAVIGFVNGMYILFNFILAQRKRKTHFSRSFSLPSHSEGKEKHTQRHLKKTNKKEKNVGMTQRNGTHDNIGMK